MLLRIVIYFSLSPGKWGTTLISTWIDKEWIYYVSSNGSVFCYKRISSLSHLRVIQVIKALIITCLDFIKRISWTFLHGYGSWRCNKVGNFELLWIVIWKKVIWLSTQNTTKKGFDFFCYLGILYYFFLDDESLESLIILFS